MAPLLYLEGQVLYGDRWGVFFVEWGPCESFGSFISSERGGGADEIPTVALKIREFLISGSFLDLRDFDFRKMLNLRPILNSRFQK